MKRGFVLGALIVIGTLSTALTAYQQPAQRAVLPDLQKVKDNFYIIGSSSPVDRSMFTGGNTGVFITDAGVVVVDTKLANYGPDILAKIRAVTSKPVTMIINTHTHGDHTGSNEAFGGTVDIIAQPEKMADDFKQMIEVAMARGIPDARLRVWAPQGSEVLFVRQVSPTVEDLTARRQTVNPLTGGYPTGAWGD